MTQAEDTTNYVEKEVAFLEHMKAEAARTATALIQSYLGPDHKVFDMAKFHSGLSQALRQAREQGQVDKSGDVVTLL